MDAVLVFRVTGYALPRLNGVTPVAVTHVCLADAAFPETVDEIKQIAFLKDTCLSFKIQGPGILYVFCALIFRVSNSSAVCSIVIFFGL